MTEQDAIWVQRCIDEGLVKTVEPDHLPVKDGCICPNRHQPIDGMIITSPACCLHGSLTRAVPRRAVGVFGKRNVGRWQGGDKG